MSERAWQDWISEAKRPYPIEIRCETEPLSSTGLVYRAYYAAFPDAKSPIAGLPFYVSGETLHQCMDRVWDDHPEHVVYFGTKQYQGHKDGTYTCIY